MSKRTFEISQSGHDTIRIEADDGYLFDDWKDLTAPSCLIAPSGGFKIGPTETVFTSSKVQAFVLRGKPFDANVGETGEAILDLTVGCPTVDWVWKRTA